jgi:hypothetical protein
MRRDPQFFHITTGHQSQIAASSDPCNENSPLRSPRDMSTEAMDYGHEQRRITSETWGIHVTIDTSRLPLREKNWWLVQEITLKLVS